MKPVPNSKADGLSLEKAGISLHHTYHESPASHRRIATYPNTGSSTPSLLVKVPFSKRLFDITIAGMALLILSPLLVVACTLVKLDSKEPVLYRSRRVGRGYKIFELYTFRTTQMETDTMLSHVVTPHLDRQGKESQALSNTYEECRQPSTVAIVNTEKEVVCEKSHLYVSKKAYASIKFANKSRVTLLSKLLRTTHIERLPQLLNILKGDLSLVGNQPLPTYEAERLITNGYLIRFAAPVGLTGLWQVAKRSKKELSELERIQLDIKYAENYSFWLDMKIILKTFLALLQKKNN